MSIIEMQFEYKLDGLCTGIGWGWSEACDLVPTFSLSDDFCVGSGDGRALLSLHTKQMMA